MTTKQGRPTDYIELMLATAIQARSYIEGLSKEDFLADPKTQDAVILKLLVIGERSVLTNRATSALHLCIGGNDGR